MKNALLSKNSKFWLGFLLTLVCIACILRFYKLTYEDLWLDEVFDLHNALRPSLREAVDSSIRNNHSPLDIALLFYWIRMFKNSYLVLGMRLLYAVIGVFAVMAFFWFCRLINERRIFLFPYTAALFFALSEQAMYYSREGRSYIFVLLFSILSFGFYIKVLRRGRWFDIVFYILFSVLLLYSHFCTVMVLITHNVFYLYDFFIKKRNGVFPKKWFFVQIAVFMLYLPLFLESYPVLLNQCREGLLIPPVDIRVFFHGLSWIVHPQMQSADRMIRYLLCFFIVVCIVGRIRRCADANRESGIFVLLMLWVFIPPVFLFIFSKWVTPVFATRYFIVSLVPLLALSVLGYFSIRTKIAKMVLLMCLLVLYTRSYSNWFVVKHKERYKDVFSYVDKNRFDDRRTIILFNPKYYALPILLHLDIEGFRRMHSDGSDIMKYLNNRDIYCFDKKVIYELLNKREKFNLFTLESQARREDIRRILNKLADLHVIRDTYIKPFIITQYLVAAQGE